MSFVEWLLIIDLVFFRLWRNNTICIQPTEFYISKQFIVVIVDNSIFNSIIMPTADCHLELADFVSHSQKPLLASSIWKYIITFSKYYYRLLSAEWGCDAALCLNKYTQTLLGHQRKYGALWVRPIRRIVDCLFAKCFRLCASCGYIVGGKWRLDDVWAIEWADKRKPSRARLIWPFGVCCDGNSNLVDEYLPSPQTTNQQQQKQRRVLINYAPLLFGGNALVGLDNLF